MKKQTVVGYILRRNILLWSMILKTIIDHAIVFRKQTILGHGVKKRETILEVIPLYGNDGCATA